MGAFKASVITDKGKTLSAKAVTSPHSLQFTKIAISEDILAGAIEGFTDIGTIKQEKPISEITEIDDYNIKVGAVFDNTALPTGYYVRNIGLYALDPDEGEILYSVSIAEDPADWMPPYSENTSTASLIVNVQTQVSNMESVYFEVNPTGLVSMGQFLGHTGAKNNPHNVTAEQVGALPLDGSKAMKGGITIGDGQARLSSNEYIATINAYKDPNNPTDAYGSIWVHNDGALSHTVEVTKKESGKDPATYQLFGSHNKPTNTYVGNGDKTQREINTGGIGNALLIYRNEKSAIVLPSCAIFCSNGVFEVTWDVTFKNGSLTMQTTSEYANADGVTYNYQVL